ncbi:MAG: hypothetical protein VYC17_06850 [Nitrospinota bacterium]|nr:hypothetical protein [Nitrospinota bacterium]
MNPVTILVIRSAARVFNPTLASLKEEFPGSKVAVLAHESVAPMLSQDPMVDEVLPLKSQERISAFKYGPENIRSLRTRKFDIAVSLYNIERGLGYSNIDFLAWMSGAEQLRGYNCKGGFVILTRNSIIKTYFREKMSTVWVVLNFLATIILFFLIALGMIFEWGFRKLFKQTFRPDAG